MADIAGEGFVQSASRLFQAADFDVYAGGTKLFESLSADLRIGIGHGRDHAMNPCGDQRVGTRGGAALMGVGFEVDVKSCAAGLLASTFQRENLSVLYTLVGVSPRADHITVRVGDDRADVRIGRGQTDSLARQFEGAVEKLLVGGVSGHAE